MHFTMCKNDRQDNCGNKFYQGIYDCKYQGQDNNQILAIFWAYLGYESYGMYTATHQKKRLVAAAAGVIAGILFAITYVIHVIAK